MLNIDRQTLNHLDFDFEAALEAFAEAQRQHPFTVNIPAPTAHPLVEEAFRAGGFQIVEPPPEEPPPPPPVDPAKRSALDRLNKMQGKTVGTQLDEMRAVLIQFFESMPG